MNWKNKTFWFNMLALAVAVAGHFGYIGELPDEWAVFVPAIVAIVNILLKYLANKPAGIKYNL